MSFLGKLLHVPLARYVIILILLGIILRVALFYEWGGYIFDTFANKNSRTVLEVQGQILGMDMVDHPDTFDYEPYYELHPDYFPLETSYPPMV
jgi:hypothetical protein